MPATGGEKAVLSMNKVILMGRLTGDPEGRYTQSNISVARFSLAVNRIGRQQEGQPTADFFDIVAWRQTADFVGKYFKKGQQVLVEGYLRNNNWTDQQGQKRYRTEVHVDHAYFADSRRDGQGGGDYPQSGGYQRDNAGGGYGGGSGGSYGGGNQGGGSQGGNAAGFNAPAAGGAPSGGTVPEAGDGFYTLNEDDEDLPF
jgi:single-strand DNA-binding protein